MTSAGPSAQPQRQPVIAYDLLADPHRIDLSRHRAVSTLGRLCGTGS
jgi:hypothetical protein